MENLDKSVIALLDDEKIVELYWERSERAVAETDVKYGKYCRAVAYNILRCKEDSEECVNDAYVSAWESMPPQRPNILKAYIGKLTRNIALNRYDYNHAQKRAADTDAVADEFWECIADKDMSVEDEVMLKEIVDGFLGSLSKRKRVIFMRRYWYLCSVKEIAESMGSSESNIKVTLHRTREKFREYLEKEGVTV